MPTMRSFAREQRFDALCEAVQQCTLCPRLSGHNKVLSRANGAIAARVMLVAEAPGRLGADVTGIPLNGDQTGRNFEALLRSVGWQRQDVFTTNAVLCNPRAKDGNNRPPTRREVTNCTHYLAMTISLVDPQVVVTLGAVALAAMGRIQPHAYSLRSTVGQTLPWAGRVLVPLYHPGPRATVHRSSAEQEQDFRCLARYVDPSDGIVASPPAESTCQRFDAIQTLAYSFVRSLGRMSYFKLTKMLYLADITAIERLGHSLTGTLYIRQREGPWPPDLHKALQVLDGREIRRFFSGRRPMVDVGPAPRIEAIFPPDELDVIAEVVERCSSLTDSGMKMAAYRTAPMRFVREQEKAGRDMLNKAVVYNDQTVSERGE
jgi:uracil-DNA glycosylase family 4